MDYTVQLDTYQGPLDLLLDLIERNQLDVCDIALSQVTQDFLDFVASHDLSLEERSWFTIIAVALVYVKSRVLLPGQDSLDTAEASEETDLTERLRRYKQYKNAAKILGDQSVKPMFTRSAKLAQKDLAPIDLAHLQQIFWELMAKHNKSQQIAQTVTSRKQALHNCKVKFGQTFYELTKFDLDMLIARASSQLEATVFFLLTLDNLKTGHLVVTNQQHPFELEWVSG